MSDFDIGAAESQRGSDTEADGVERSAQPAAKIVEKAVGAAHDAVDQIADQAHATVDEAGERSTELYARVADKAEKVASAAGPFIKEKPYAAVGLAAVAGLIAGLLLASRRPRVIYLRPKA